MRIKARYVVLILILAWAPFAHADERRYSVPLEDSPAYGPANAPVTLFNVILHKHRFRDRRVSTPEGQARYT